MRIIITDANIFFDLISVGLLNEFFLLDFDICTTDFVINEIKHPEQLLEINLYIHSQQLIIFKFNPEEISEIIGLQTKRNLKRITDKSVLWKAHQLDCHLLTGDKNLRLEAQDLGIKVNGILWVVEILADSGYISNIGAIDILEKLKTVNGWLPVIEIEKMIKRFGG